MSKKEMEQLRAELVEVKSECTALEAKYSALQAELAALQGALDRFTKGDGVQSMILWSRCKVDAGVKRPSTEFQPAPIRQDV